jgi:hypothetical protein
MVKRPLFIQSLVLWARLAIVSLWEKDCHLKRQDYVFLNSPCLAIPLFMT